MIRFESFDSDWSTVSDVSNASFSSYNSDVSVFIDEKKVKEKYIKETNEKSRQTAHQLAASSASKQYPKFTNQLNRGKCSMLHWACHVGWCLCKYQYQPLTSIHLLPCTPIPANHDHSNTINYQIEYKPTTLPLYLASHSTKFSPKNKKLKATKISQKQVEVTSNKTMLEKEKIQSDTSSEEKPINNEIYFETPLETTV